MLCGSCGKEIDDGFERCPECGAELENDVWTIDLRTDGLDREDSDVQFIVGERYYDGKGVRQDYEEAVKWYMKSAEQGNAEAQFKMGECYYNGKGVERNEDEAIMWLSKAAGQGHELAISYLLFLF